MTDYADVRDKMRPGDVIAFGGKGRASSIIKRFTQSVVSHVGLVRHVQMISPDDYDLRYFNEIVESTSLGGFSGVQTSRLSTRLLKYDGEAWWLPLNNECRARFDEEKYWNWLYTQDGKPYDTPQAIRAGFDFLESIGVGVNVEDYSKLFCSELAAGALRQAGVLFKDLKYALSRVDSSGLQILPSIFYVCSNASEETPIQLCKRPIWMPPVQLKGDPMKILS